MYVKPYNNEEMSYVKKVNICLYHLHSDYNEFVWLTAQCYFKLHESYANPNRILTNAPYEVTETGWGEFEVVIKIYFHDPTERPVTLYHILKLFQSPVEGEESQVDSKRGLVSESYEEIVFQEPTQLMQHYLTNIPPVTEAPWKHDTDCK